MARASFRELLMNGLIIVLGLTPHGRALLGNQYATKLALESTFQKKQWLTKTEREGFEPSVRPYVPYNSLAGCRFQPLSHLSRQNTILANRGRILSIDFLGQAPRLPRVQRNRLPLTLQSKHPWGKQF